MVYEEVLRRLCMFPGELKFGKFEVRAKKIEKCIRRIQEYTARGKMLLLANLRRLKHLAHKVFFFTFFSFFSYISERNVAIRTSSTSEWVEWERRTRHVFRFGDSECKSGRLILSAKV